MKLNLLDWKFNTKSTNNNKRAILTTLNRYKSVNMFKLPNKCSICLKIAAWRCQAKHRTSIRDFNTDIKPHTFPAPQPPKSPPPALCSTEYYIKMGAPKILMESGDLTKKQIKTKENKKIKKKPKIKMK